MADKQSTQQRHRDSFTGQFTPTVVGHPAPQDQVAFKHPQRATVAVRHTARTSPLHGLRGFFIEHTLNNGGLRPLVYPQRLLDSSEPVRIIRPMIPSADAQPSAAARWLKRLKGPVGHADFYLLLRTSASRRIRLASQIRRLAVWGKGSWAVKVRMLVVTGTT